MTGWWTDCETSSDVELSPKISAVQIEAITWPREASRRWLGEKLIPLPPEGPPKKGVKDDPELTRRINDSLALHAEP